MKYYIIINLTGKENKVSIKTNKNTTILGVWSSYAKKIIDKEYPLFMKYIIKKNGKYITHF